MKILITGGCGFIGSNLAAHGQDLGYEVHLLDNLYRSGSKNNLEWLKKRGKIFFYREDIRNQKAVDELFRTIRFDAVFHLAAQVAMTTSLENPRYDFEVNALGTFNVLDAIKNFQPDTPLLYSSTNKVYGDLENFTYEEGPTRYTCIEAPAGFDEQVKIDMHSPYGVSKGTADQYVLDFSRMYGLKTAVFRHSSMYGGRQYATYDQGWIEWFCHKAVEQKKQTGKIPFTISGNGKQVRDILHCNDVVNLYYSALKNIEKIKGDVFNIGGGIDNSLSLLELFDLLEKLLSVKLEFTMLPPRQSDQKIFVADNTKITAAIGWYPLIDIKRGIEEAIQWVSEIDNESK